MSTSRLKRCSSPHCGRINMRIVKLLPPSLEINWHFYHSHRSCIPRSLIASPVRPVRTTHGCANKAQVAHTSWNPSTRPFWDVYSPRRGATRRMPFYNTAKPFLLERTCYLDTTPTIWILSSVCHASDIPGIATHGRTILRGLPSHC